MGGIFPPRPPRPPKPTERLVATTVNGGATGILRPYVPVGASYTAVASETGRLEWKIPNTVTGGSKLHFELAGYGPWDGDTILDPELPNGPFVLWPDAPPQKPLPPIPTRAQVCSIKMSLQGLTYHTRDYGDMPGVFFWSVYQDRKESVFPEHRKVGDTHLPVGLSGSYNEPSTIWPPEITKGGDLTHDLPAFKRQLREVIDEGLFCDVPLSGDGESIRKDGSLIAHGEYNDPVGSTYGYQWMMQNLERILLAVKGDPRSECPDGEDLTPYCIFRPGWDGCFYGWSEDAASGGLSVRQKLDALGKRFRQILPSGYLAIEHTPGNIPAGEGPSDWVPGGCMIHYDTLLSEYDTPFQHNDKVWQIAGRTLGQKKFGGTFVRPPDMPVGDDPDPPYYLQTGSPRGPFFVVAFEIDAYRWSRGQISLESLTTERAYLRAMGYTLVC